MELIPAGTSKDRPLICFVGYVTGVTGIGFKEHRAVGLCDGNIPPNEADVRHAGVVIFHRGDGILKMRNLGAEEWDTCVWMCGKRNPVFVGTKLKEFATLQISGDLECAFRDDVRIPDAAEAQIGTNSASFALMRNGGNPKRRGRAWGQFDKIVVHFERVLQDGGVGPRNRRLELTRIHTGHASTLKCSGLFQVCLLYTSDAADECPAV